MTDSANLLPFTLSDKRFALNINSVERVVRSVEITPLPKAPTIVLGIVNVAGRIIPVVNGRVRFGAQHRPLTVRDRFIIAKGSERTIALVADAVSTVIEVPSEMMTYPDRIIPGIGHVEAVARRGDSIIVVLTVEQILNYDESKEFDAALADFEKGVDV
jgi:purine-binding chemotaxis protein CheW